MALMELQDVTVTFEGHAAVEHVSLKIERGEFKSSRKEAKIEVIVPENYYFDKVEVEAGDFVCIDAGMLHALGKGILALEIGQNSNTTYRFYDYHRQDANGRERELHIDKSFDVADFGLHCNKVASPFTDADTTQEKLLVDRREFSVRLVDVAGSYVLPQDEKRFYCLSNVSADCVLRYQGEELPFAFTENIFVPAGCADIEICGKARILVSFVR